MQRFLDLIFPPLCLNCDEPVGGDQTLCPECWKKIHFITTPYCQRCGLPFSIPVEADTLCTSCLTTEPEFSRARSVYLYDDASKPIILKFKHGDQLHPTKALSQWMGRAAAEFLPDIDWVVPVPLHYWRLFHRKYNQAALLGQAIAKQHNKPFAADALRRIKATPSQGHLSRKERYSNVKRAFQVPKSWQQRLVNKKILLVDDVLTSGATVNACSEVLKNAGASAIYVITVARVQGTSGT